MAVEQGSHPILDLVSTSEVITALSRKKEVKHTKQQVPEILQRMVYTIPVISIELDRTHPSMVPAHEISPGGDVRRVGSGPSVR